ncbi:hypothetical protein AX16_003399 [Volvariella volvacea WC 439]|nr:hypothetical protein AX16_003399 [Volvariella volvacea WC 439]
MPAPNIGVPTIDDLRVRLCYICREEESGLQGSGPIKEWTHPCQCTLVAHEECLLQWIQAALNDPGRAKNALKCPQCGAKYEMQSENPEVLKIMSSVERFGQSFGKFCLVAGAVGTVCIVGTGIVIVLTGYGSWALKHLLGQEMFDLIITDNPANWKWPMVTNIFLVPISLILSRFKSRHLIPPTGLLAWPLATPVSQHWRLDKEPLIDLYAASDANKLIAWPPPPFVFTFILMPAVRWGYSKLFKRLAKRVLGETEGERFWELGATTTEGEEGNENQIELRINVNVEGVAGAEEAPPAEQIIEERQPEQALPQQQEQQPQQPDAAQQVNQQGQPDAQPTMEDILRRRDELQQALARARERRQQRLQEQGQQVDGDQPQAAEDDPDADREQRQNLIQRLDQEEAALRREDIDLRRQERQLLEERRVQHARLRQQLDQLRQDLDELERQRNNRDNNNNNGRDGNRRGLAINAISLGRTVGGALLIPLIASTMGRLLLGLSRKSSWLHKFLAVKPPLKSRGGPFSGIGAFVGLGTSGAGLGLGGKKYGGYHGQGLEFWKRIGIAIKRTLLTVYGGTRTWIEADPVWWRNAIGLGLFVVAKDVLTLWYRYLSKKEQTTRHLANRNFEGIDIKELDLKPSFYIRNDLPVPELTSQ